MPKLTFALEKATEGEVCVLKPIGWLTEEGHAELLDELKVLQNGGHRRFVVNMSAANVLDVSGLGALLRLARDLAHAGGRLVLASPDSFARRMLFGGNLGALPPICETVSEAVTVAGRKTSSGWRGPVAT